MGPENSSKVRHHLPCEICFTKDVAFWVMWYFLQEYYEISNNTFIVSNILSASEPMDWDGSGIKRLSESGMINFCNQALEKYRKQGKPDWKQLKK